MRLLLLLGVFMVGCPKPVQTETPRDRTQEVYASVVALLDEDGDAFCTGTMVHDYVLTAAHCVEGLNTLNEIGFYRDYVRATESWSQTFTYAVVRLDEVGTDLALLKVVDAGGSYVNANLSPDLPALGQTVMAIGHPVGLYYSLSLGIVTVPHRSRIGDEAFEWTQASVGVSPGNSGGPLLNEHGEVLGVCSFRMQSRGGGEPHLGGFVHLSSVRRFLSQANLPVVGG